MTHRSRAAERDDGAVTVDLGKRILHLQSETDRITMKHIDLSGEVWCDPHFAAFLAKAKGGTKQGMESSQWLSVSSRFPVPSAFMTQMVP